MHDIQMFKGARKILEICAGARAGEEVLIVGDYHTERLVRVLAAAADSLAAEPVITFLVPRDRDGQEPPKAIANAMLRADVILTPVSRSITHTAAMKAAIQAGARALMMTQFTDDMLVHGGIEADFAALAPRCRALAQRFQAGRQLHLTTASGTDLRASIEGRRGNALTCLVKPGEFSTVPTVEANVSPLEGSANGRLVFDASVPYMGIGLLESPIEAEVSSGRICSLTGGAQARRLKQILDGFGDPQVYNVAEIGLGLNDRSRLIGVMLEDEGVQGTLHIGIGTSITLGGTVKAACHYDLLLWHPTIDIDGSRVVDQGVFCG